MKKIVLGLFLFLSIGIYAQELNKVIIDPDLNREILIGWVNREGISSKDYLVNEQLKYEAYEANPEALKFITKAFSKEKSLRILVVFATWCGDSKMHVPEFFKVADLAKIKNVKYLAVSRKKTAQDIDMSKMDIQRVPTFIVYKGKTELGRIIESPNENIEKDLVRILQKK
jgi:thiol-disulfide isomerase/thioredoxin